MTRGGEGGGHVGPKRGVCKQKGKVKQLVEEEQGAEGAEGGCWTLQLMKLEWEEVTQRSK